MDMQNSHSGNRYNSNYLYHELPNYAASNTAETTLSEAHARSLDVDGLMTLFMNNQSTRQLAKTIVQFNGLAVLGALAYKAHTHWQANTPFDQITSVTGYDVTQASPLPSFAGRQQAQPNTASLITVLMKTMLAAAKAHEATGKDEQEQLLKAAKQLGFNEAEIGFVEELMNREITVQEITSSVSLGKHKCNVYLAAYLATHGKNPLEGEFLESLASALQLPTGLSNYLEQQADLGITL